MQKSIDNRLRNMVNLKFRQHIKASVLIITLCALATMTIITLGLAYRTRIHIQLTKSNAERTKAYYLAIGGIQRLKALITEKKLTPERTARICCFADNAENEKLFHKIKNKPTNNTRLFTVLKDELSFLNVNKSDPSGWEKLKCLSQTTIASIVDWTDKDNVPNPQGAETGFYKKQKPPHVCKNTPLSILRELLLVKSISRNTEKYLGKNLAEFALQKTHGNTNIHQLFDNSRNTPELGLINCFTVFGEGKININTASANIIATLQGINNQTAEYLRSQLAGADGQFGTNDDAFITDVNSISDLDPPEKLTDLETELLQQYCYCNSNYFRLYSYAESTNSRIALMATIKIDEGKGRIICVEELL